LPTLPKRVVVSALVVLFLVGVFSIVYELRMLGNAEALSTQIDSGRLDLTSAMTAYQALAKKSLFTWPLYPARRSLRNRYTAEADRVIADYREASESTPVTTRDWRRAQAALASAISLEPTDQKIRGKYDLINGFLHLKTSLKEARGDFEEARRLLPDAPDPHLGLARIRMSEGDLNQAEEELNKAERSGFRPGRREQRDLADGYRARGEQWLAEARRTHDIGQMQAYIKHGDADLAHALELYNAIAPFLNGVQLAERVSLERDKAAKTLAEAQQAITQPASVTTSATAPTTEGSAKASN
jgi:hypothetical protein